MKITDSAAFGKAIRARRKELHYTQEYLSEWNWSVESQRLSSARHCSFFRLLEWICL